MHNACSRVKRLARKLRCRAKIEVNTVGLSLRFGTRRPRVRISPARPTRFETLKTADFELVLTVWEGVGRGVGTPVENPWSLPTRSDPRFRSSIASSLEPALYLPWHELDSVQVAPTEIEHGEPGSVTFR